MTVKELISSINRTLGNMDISTLEPMTNFMFHPLWSKGWVTRIENVISQAEKNGISFKELAECISGTSHLRVQTFFLLLDLKCAKIEKARRLKIADFFVKLLQAKATEDPYGWKSNKMHTPSEISELLTNITFNSGNEETAKLLGMLYSAAYHFTNGLYTDFYSDFGVECFGEYNANMLGKNYTLVIKQFNDLKPELLWLGISSPCRTLKIYSIYSNVNFVCDAVSVHSVYKGDPIKGLMKWAIEVDGKFISSIDEIRKLKENLEICSIKQWKKLLALGHEGIKVKAVEMRNYSFKQMFEKLNIDWKPGKDMLEAVKDKPFANESFWGKKEDLCRILDPEDDFYPPGSLYSL